MFFNSNYLQFIKVKLETGYSPIENKHINFREMILLTY